MVYENLKEIKNIDKSNQIYKSNTNLSNLIVQNCVTGCLTIVNKRLNDMMGNYDKTILMHDWWAALIASSMGKIVNISDVVMYYRQHGNNVVGSVDVKSFKYRIDKLFDKNTKKAKFLYRDQMILFLNRYEKSLGDNYLVVKRFIDLFNKNKIYRMYILLKFNYLKSDIVRVIGQLLYI
ncbi:MAG: hypothetical protein KHZ15_09260 [Coprobacillus cateniformis]|nr:hypothetical protein [Coprobacillus cateniformis]